MPLTRKIYPVAQLELDLYEKVTKLIVFGRPRTACNLCAVQQSNVRREGDGARCDLPPLQLVVGSPSSLLATICVAIINVQHAPCVWLNQKKGSTL
jgi:hypothetical protein